MCMSRFRWTSFGKKGIKGLSSRPDLEWVPPKTPLISFSVRLLQIIWKTPEDNVHVQILGNQVSEQNHRYLIWNQRYEKLPGEKFYFIQDWILGNLRRCFSVGYWVNLGAMFRISRLKKLWNHYLRTIPGIYNQVMIFSRKCIFPDAIQTAQIPYGKV